MTGELPEARPEGSPARRTADLARVTVFAGFVGLSIFVLVFRALVIGQLEQTAAMFVGLPTLIAGLTLLLVRPKTAIGVSLMVATLALLAAALLFQEGFVCIAFTAPLFYGLAILVAVLYDLARRGSGGPKAFATALVPLLLLGTEGVVFSLPRANEVTAVRVVAATPDEVRQALSGPPDLATPLPASLKIGYPRPVRATGSGLTRGDLRRVRFAGGEGQPGDMVLRVTEASDRAVVFTLVDDGSHLAHWLSWDRSVVTLQPVDGGTEVHWTVHYTRLLDPAWYFHPLERLAVKAAADWLIVANATPR